ncbi:MAG: DUF1858 domain-containing protein [Candidatus Omnitrophica bacterium]|nr:DUF1858 domain-containing protein [Candidatus Omnitrophota bacterium]
MKEIDINKTVYELTQQYPELIDILSDLGFLGIKNPVLRNTLGRTTTLKQGCEKQGKNINDIIKKLEEKGYRVKKE